MADRALDTCCPQEPSSRRNTSGKRSRWRRAMASTSSRRVTRLLDEQGAPALHAAAPREGRRASVGRDTRLHEHQGSHAPHVRPPVARAGATLDDMALAVVRACVHKRVAVSCRDGIPRRFRPPARVTVFPAGASPERPALGHPVPVQELRPAIWVTREAPWPGISLRARRSVGRDGADHAAGTFACVGCETSSGGLGGGNVTWGGDSGGHGDDAHAPTMATSTPNAAVALHAVTDRWSLALAAGSPGSLAKCTRVLMLSGVPPRVSNAAVDGQDLDDKRDQDGDPRDRGRPQLGSRGRRRLPIRMPLIWA
jgi:hypothetical protein